MNAPAPQRRTANPLEQARTQIMGSEFSDQVKMALPEHISVEKFQRVVVTAIAKDPSLLQADRGSLLTSCIEAAADGLLPNGKEAALVVYNTKNRQTNQWDKKVQYIPMIGGIYKKARNSGDIALLSAELVFEADEFHYELGFDRTIRHKPSLNGDRGAIRCVYAVVVMKDGTRDLEVLTVADVEMIRKASKASDSGPWAQWWGEMARKTAVRRLSKRIPMSADLERVVQRMDALYEFEDRKRLDSGPTINLARGHLSHAANQMAAFSAPAPAVMIVAPTTDDVVASDGITDMEQQTGAEQPHLKAEDKPPAKPQQAKKTGEQSQGQQSLSQIITTINSAKTREALDAVMENVQPVLRGLSDDEYEPIDAAYQSAVAALA